MGLDKHSLIKLKKCGALKEGGSVLSLGNPDILIQKKDLVKMFGEDMGKVRLADPSYCQKAMNNHPINFRIVDSYDFFEKLGMSLYCVDIVAHEGNELLLDLNRNSIRSKYDLVLDCGTLEHCFNFGKALINVWSAVKINGFIMNENPLTRSRHGFYSPHPKLYKRFYPANGGKICLLEKKKNDLIFVICNKVKEVKVGLVYDFKNA